MFRKELSTIGLVASVIFLSVAAVVCWLGWSLQNESRLVVQDTMPGLINAGKAISRMDDNWQNLQVLVEVPSVPARSNLMRQIAANSTATDWDQYAAAIHNPQDRELFSRVQSARDLNLRLRQDYFSLINAGNLEDARRLLTNRFEPAFDQYRSDAMKLFTFNEGIGDERARHILWLTRLLPVGAAVFSVFIFGIGFLLGLRGAFTGLDFVFRRTGGGNERQDVSSEERRKEDG